MPIPYIAEGKCTCGAIHYRMIRQPLFVHCCHCTWCQRESGAAFALNAMVESEYIEVLQGEPVWIDIPSASGKGQRVARCPHCQVALWSNYGGVGDFVRFVRVGTLLEPDRAPPDIHIFTSTKQRWLPLDDSVPAVEEYYDANRHWPQESLERRQVYRQRMNLAKR